MLIDPQQTLLNQIRHGSLTEAQRSGRTDDIFRYVLANSESITRPNFTTVSDADLGLLFQITDELFFGGSVGQLCEQKADAPLVFRLSTRMTNSGGTTTMHRSGSRRSPKLEFEIAIATTPLFATFPSQRSDHPAALSDVGGVPCRNRLEALQRIMEHEMVHLIEMLLWDDSNCSGKPFKSIVYRFFGHTASNHRLLTPADVARRQWGIQPGDRVSFDFQGRSLRGWVNRITKRASVLVADPSGVLHSDGRVYKTFYVPLHRLKKAA